MILRKYVGDTRIKKHDNSNESKDITRTNAPQTTGRFVLRLTKSVFLLMFFLFPSMRWRLGWLIIHHSYRMLPQRVDSEHQNKLHSGDGWAGPFFSLQPNSLIHYLANIQTSDWYNPNHYTSGSFNLKWDTEWMKHIRIMSHANGSNTKCKIPWRVCTSESFNENVSPENTNGTKHFQNPQTRKGNLYQVNFQGESITRIPTKTDRKERPSEQWFQKGETTPRGDNIERDPAEFLFSTIARKIQQNKKHCFHGKLIHYRNKSRVSY